MRRWKVRDAGVRRKCWGGLAGLWDGEGRPYASWWGGGVCGLSQTRRGFDDGVLAYSGAIMVLEGSGGVAVRDGLCGEGRIHTGCIMNSGGGAWGMNVGQR